VAPRDAGRPELPDAWPAPCRQSRAAVRATGRAPRDRRSREPSRRSRHHASRRRSRLRPPEQCRRPPEQCRRSQPAPAVPSHRSRRSLRLGPADPRPSRARPRFKSPGSIPVRSAARSPNALVSPCFGRSIEPCPPRPPRAAPRPAAARGSATRHATACLAPGRRPPIELQIGRSAGEPCGSPPRRGRGTRSAPRAPAGGRSAEPGEPFDRARRRFPRHRGRPTWPHRPGARPSGGDSRGCRSIRAPHPPRSSPRPRSPSRARRGRRRPQQRDGHAPRRGGDRAPRRSIERRP